MENLAERLFVDLKNARIKIDQPLYAVDGFRISDHGAKQFVLSGRKEFNVNLGPAIEVGNKTFIDAYNDLLMMVKDVGNHLKFYQLVIPRRGVVDTKLLEFETVIGRYVKDYLPQMDEVYERWDFLVAPVKN